VSCPFDLASYLLTYLFTKLCIRLWSSCHWCYILLSTWLCERVWSFDLASNLQSLTHLLTY